MNRSLSAGVAGLCFFGCIGIVVLAYAMQAIRVYGPLVRDLIHATLTPQFAAGMFFMAFVACLAAFCIGLGVRK